MNKLHLRDISWFAIRNTGMTIIRFFQYSLLTGKQIKRSSDWARKFSITCLRKCVKELQTLFNFVSTFEYYWKVAMLYSAY